MARKTNDLVCPYTGQPVEIRKLSAGGFMGCVSAPYGGYTTRVFRFREQLVDFLRHRAGVLKGEPTYVTIKVTEREPPRPAIDPSEKRASEDLDEIAQIAAGNAVRAARDVGAFRRPNS